MKSSFATDVAVLPVAAPQRKASRSAVITRTARARGHAGAWLLVVMLAGSCTFAVTFAQHVLGGATQVLTAAGAEPWSPQGP